MKVVIIDKDGNEQQLEPRKIIVSGLTLEQWFKNFMNLDKTVKTIQKEIKLNNDKLNKLVDSL